jgi:tetratricopeptide (TPR) repeat protein
MGQITRCPLVGTSCTRPITIQEKTFFLAEAEEPEYDRKHRKKALGEAIVDGYKIRSALEEKNINAFTCKICEMIQACAYGMADISQNNANVYMELGIMLALGKPTVILAKKGEEQRLKLPSDVSAIEVILFDEYLDIVDQLREVVKKLPPTVPISSPLEDIGKLDPRLAEELRKMRDTIVRQFSDSIREAKLDTVSLKEERKEISPDLSDKLRSLEEKLEDLTGLGFVTDEKTAFMRGNYFYEQKKFEKALANYNWSLGLAPDDPDTLSNRGSTYADLGRYDEALADYNRSLKIRPDNPVTLNNRGSTYDELERYDEALADYNRSLKVRPDNPDTLSNRGVTYANLERYDEALADYNRSLKVEPDNPDTLTNRGSAYTDLGRYDEALADYNRSLKVRPDNPDTLTNRGNTYTKLGKYDEALADYNRSLKVRPDDPATLYNLACLFSLWGKTDDTLAYLKKAIDKSKKYSEMARTDKDFDNIRDGPRFKKLILE